MRTTNPKSLVGYRFALNYEDDAPSVGRCTLLPDPNPNELTNCCDQITPNATGCSATRGLLTRIGVEWIEVSGTVTPGPSMEFKYEPGGLSSRGEVRLAKILAGAFRAEAGYSTDTLPVLATFTYDNAATQSAQLRAVKDARYGTGDLSVKLGFQWIASTGANRWQLSTVQEIGTS